MIYCLGCLAPLLIPMIVHLGMTVAVECQRDTPVLQDWLLNSEIIFAFGQTKSRPAMSLQIRPGLRFPVQEPKHPEESIANMLILEIVELISFASMACHVNTDAHWDRSLI